MGTKIAVNRFLVFAAEATWDKDIGGWENFVGSFTTLKQAIACAKLQVEDCEWWWHIVDLRKGKIVKKFGYK